MSEHEYMRYSLFHLDRQQAVTLQAQIKEMLVSAMFMKEGLKMIKPLIASGSEEKKGKVLIGTVKGDLHDIGKNIVAMLF